jgi:hypothetical protein
MRTSRSSRRFILLLAASAAVIAFAPSSLGADPFVAGGRSTRPVAADAVQAARAVDRGADLARALGMPGVSRRAERLDDRFEHRVYDEVVSVDASGREVAVARFDTDGRVAMVLVLGWHRGTGRPITDSVAADRGAELARAAGLRVSGRPHVRTSAGVGGWSVSWPRAVDGVPVLGDGVRVSLWADGSFHALTRTERPLAAAPAKRLAAGTARHAAESIAAQRFGSGARDLRVVASTLAWVAPNDTWAPDHPDAPAETLRLAWIVRLEARGSLTERLRLVEYWIDAGDGALLGGDVAE